MNVETISVREFKQFLVGRSADIYRESFRLIGAHLLQQIASVPHVIFYLLFSEQVKKALTVGAAVKG